jgi:hypothetical protein
MTTEKAAIPMVGLLIMEKTLKADGYITALMITDNRGYPLEFKATTPVRPSLVQKTLYGDKLEHFISVELCGNQLIKQSGRKPKTILVPDKKLLDIANKTDCNVVAIWRSGEKIKVEEDAQNPQRGTIRSTSFQPVVYEGRFKDDATQKEIITFLQVCSSHFDLIEAFERMRAALQLLAKEDSRYA